MRVLHVISGIEPENGGPTAALCGMATGLRDAGDELSIVATWKSESAFTVAERLRTAGIKVTLLGPTKRPFRNHPQLRSVLEAETRDADVVHIHAMWEAIEHTAARVARRLGKPYVWTPHGMLDRYNMSRNRLFKSACLWLYLRRDLSRAARLHVASEFERLQVTRHRLPTRTVTIGFGVDEALFEAPPASIGRPRGFEDGVPVVLYLGRVQRGKGLEILIPAMAAVAAPTRLVVAGPDEGLQAAMETLAARHQVADRVRFIGMIGPAEKLAALRGARVLAAPSLHENFGVAVAEAIAVGTAVVVSDQVGLESMIRENNVGVVTSLRVENVAGAINRMLQLDHERSDRARQLAEEVFSWPHIVQRWRNCYCEVAANL